MPANGRCDLIRRLAVILLTWRIWWAPNNASKWQMGINSAFKVLRKKYLISKRGQDMSPRKWGPGWCPSYICNDMKTTEGFWGATTNAWFIPQRKRSHDFVTLTASLWEFLILTVTFLVQISRHCQTPHTAIPRLTSDPANEFFG